MKKILISLMIGIFIIGIVIGIIGMVTGFITSNFDITGCGAIISLMSLAFLAALPTVLDVLEEYLKSM